MENAVREGKRPKREGGEGRPEERDEVPLSCCRAEVYLDVAGIFFMDFDSDVVTGSERGREGSENKQK
jgi:hypothetical protein